MYGGIFTYSSNQINISYYKDNTKIVQKLKYFLFKIIG